jgi:hypothetical protein
MEGVMASGRMDKNYHQAVNKYADKILLSNGYSVPTSKKKSLKSKAITGVLTHNMSHE